MVAPKMRRVQISSHLAQVLRTLAIGKLGGFRKPLPDGSLLIEVSEETFDFVQDKALGGETWGQACERLVARASGAIQ